MPQCQAEGSVLKDPADKSSWVEMCSMKSSDEIRWQVAVSSFRFWSLQFLFSTFFQWSRSNSFFLFLSLSLPSPLIMGHEWLWNMHNRDVILALQVNINPTFGLLWKSQPIGFDDIRCLFWTDPMEIWNPTRGVKPVLWSPPPSFSGCMTHWKCRSILMLMQYLGHPKGAPRLQLRSFSGIKTYERMHFLGWTSINPIYTQMEDSMGDP